MKYFLNKDQMETLKSIGVPLKTWNVSAYYEILDTHCYDVEDGCTFRIYSNFSISETMDLHEPFCFGDSNKMYAFSIKQVEGEWVAGYYPGDGGEGVIEARAGEMIDSLYELYLMRDELVKSMQDGSKQG